MNCPKCNSIINQGENFCKVCGYNFNQNQQQSNYNQTCASNILVNEANNSININNNTSYLSNESQIINQNIQQNYSSQNNQEILNVTTNNSGGEKFEKMLMFKYLLKCYLPFAIIYAIYMFLNKVPISQCVNNSTDDGFICLIIFFFNEIGFILANFVIVLPFVIFSTRELLIYFDEKQTKLKLIDLIVMIITSVTSVFLASKIGVVAFFLVPIIALLYFTSDKISKKSSKVIYFLVILSLLISGVAANHVFYKTIVTYNIAIIPTLSIVFYLLNNNKVNFKIHKVIPIMLVLILSVISSYQFLLKNQKSFAEVVEKEDINLNFEDISYIDELVYSDDEKIYIISSKSSDTYDTEYLSKYNFTNNEFEVLFSNINNTTSGDGLLFFVKNNNIYMINTKTDEIKKIIDKKYYGNTSHIILYDNGNLYFTSKNHVYVYNTANSNVNSFLVDEKNNDDTWENERIEIITKDAVITSKCRFASDDNSVYGSALCAYDYNGNKMLVFKNDGEYFLSDNIITSKKNIYYFDKDKNKIILKQMNKNNYVEYSIDLNDIYYIENDDIKFSSINNFDYLGIYKNKVYVVISYTLKKEDYESYENIYYFDLLDSDNMDRGKIKLNALREPYEIFGFMDIETGTIGPYTDDRSIYFDNQYIYMISSKEKIMYKYDLENGQVEQKSINTDLKFYSVYNNYVYTIGGDDSIIYRIDKNNLNIEKILGQN